jgi:hypothetical protein
VWVYRYEYHASIINAVAAPARGESMRPFVQYGRVIAVFAADRSNGSGWEILLRHIVGEAAATQHHR